MADPAKLRERARKLREYAARLTAEANRASANAPGSYVTGGSGRSRAQNRASDRALDKTITNAVKSVAAIRKAETLERRAAWLENGEDEKLLERRKRDREREKKTRATTKARPLAERLFSGIYPTGIVYADRGRERNGNYHRLAFLPYRSLILEFRPDCSPEWREIIEADAAPIIARRGEQYQVSTCGQTVRLGA